MARIREKKGYKKRNTVMPEITLTPLIDTVLVLLVVFMIATPLLHNHIAIELPTSTTNDEAAKLENSQDPVGVFLDKDKNLFINDVPVVKEKFFDELEKKLAGAQERVVFVHADRSVPYGVVIQIVDDIKYLGGVKYVALATEHA